LFLRAKGSSARDYAAHKEVDNRIIGAGVHVITTNAGLRSPDTRVTRSAIRQFAAEDIDPDNRAYRRPLERSAKALRGEIGDCEVVLLGSIASPKYVDALLQGVGNSLVFPVDLVGGGDMSRGGLLLRQAAANVELPYVPVAGAVRHGKRPPKLAPLCRERT